MNNLKLVIIFLIFILNSCSQTFQNNGLSQRNLENFDIKIGKTSKKFLIKNYGPPIFENTFKNNIIYYVSHNTSYETFGKRETKKLLVLEIMFDDKNIVQKIKKYSEKDSFDIKVSKFEDEKEINLVGFWKDIIRSLSRRQSID